jgi:hypothetical protein
MLRSIVGPAPVRAMLPSLTGPSKRDRRYHRRDAFEFDRLGGSLYRRRQRNRKFNAQHGMFEFLLAVILIGAAAAAVLAACGPQLLFGWYLHEVRGRKVRQAPEDAIITYPLA